MIEYNNTQIPRADMWIYENHQEIVRAGYRVKGTLFSKKSEFQQIDIIETEGFGKMLLNDGLIMVTERDEFIYHEMIAHLPLFTHPNPERVLIIGGGDGGTAREVFRHKNIKHCTMVEIDPVVIEGCKKFFPNLSCSFDDPRMNLLIQDGVKFVKETQEKFDVILVDSTDPFGPAAALFNEDFYRNVDRILNPEGIVISQGESPFYDHKAQVGFLKILNTVFDRVHIYNLSNLTYPGGLWNFTYSSRGIHPLRDFDASKVEKSGMSFKYYNEGIHHACFQLPGFMRENYKGQLSSLK